MNELLRETLSTLLYVIITICVPFFLKCIFDILREKINGQIANNEYLQSSAMLSQVLDLTERVVDEINQTYVDSLKKSGKFDKEAQQTAMDDAMTYLQSLISTDLREFIESNYNDLEKFLITQIESCIARKKNENFLPFITTTHNDNTTF